MRARAGRRPVLRGRSPSAVVAAAVALVAVGTAIVSVVTGQGSVWAFEVLAVLGVLVGVVVALGGLDRAPAGGGGSRGGGAARAVPRLAEATAAHLASLDPVEHRRLELGAPWPAVVVGPTGISVVHVAADHAGGPCLDRIAEVLATVRVVAAQVSTAHPVDVRGLLVAAPGGVPQLPAGVRRVCPEHLDGAMASGPLVPMTTVTELFTRLSGQLVTVGEPGRR